MSDQDKPAPDESAFDDAAFDDPAFDDLRALLAETRVSEPVPAEVAARLDATLGALRDQRRTEDSRPSAPVVRLRRRAARVLVAAAAVAVIGAGGYGIVHSGDGGSAGDSRASGGAASETNADKAAPQVPAEQPSTSALSGLSAKAATLRSAHFARDAATLMRTLSAADVADSLGSAPSAPTPAPSGSAGSSGSLDYAAEGSKALEAPPITATPGTLSDQETVRGPQGCAGPTAPGAVTVDASLDGVPVALVFRPPTATAQVVEAWSCDGSSLLASATVPH